MLFTLFQLQQLHFKPFIPIHLSIITRTGLLSCFTLYRGRQPVRGSCHNSERQQMNAETNNALDGVRVIKIERNKRRSFRSSCMPLRSARLYYERLRFTEESFEMYFWRDGKEHGRI